MKIKYFGFLVTAIFCPLLLNSCGEQESVNTNVNKKFLVEFTNDFKNEYFVNERISYEGLVVKDEQTKEETSKKLLQKAYKLKALEEVSKNEEINYKILKKVFDTRSINLEELCVKIIKEKDKYFMQTFDEKLAEEKIELEELENIAKKELELKVGKKIKIFS